MLDFHRVSDMLFSASCGPLRFPERQNKLSHVAVLKLKSNERESEKKKKHFSGLLFFLSILEAGSSAVEAVGPGRSQRSVFVLKYILVYKLDRIKSS